jgi:hypothetical protein
MSVLSGVALRRGVLIAGVAAVLAACGTDKPVPPCPPVRIDNTTAALTKFREGPGRDLTDVAYEVRVVGYKGFCRFDKKGRGVDVSMDLVMDVASGPAATSEEITIPYFVALPQFFPQPEGKRVFEVRHHLQPGTGRRARIEEHDVHTYIPLKKDAPAAAFDVYVGLQLTPDELEYNRSLQHK